MQDYRGPGARQKGRDYLGWHVLTLAKIKGQRLRDVELGIVGTWNIPNTQGLRSTLEDVWHAHSHPYTLHTQTLMHTLTQVWFVGRLFYPKGRIQFGTATSAHLCLSFRTHGLLMTWFCPEGTKDVSVSGFFVVFFLFFDGR